MFGFIRFGLSFPDKDRGRLEVGEGLNFRSMFGDVGVELDRGGLSAGFMLTDTGLFKGSCLGGTLSGGPIGLSSLFLFLLFSFSSLLLLLLFFSLLSSLIFVVVVMGVIVMELEISDVTA